MRVVTRFAPSPTGYLHIGGARTALFNWLFARAHGGRYLLRIEDTDRARSTDAAIGAIIEGLNWLGLEADEAPIFQFARAPRHREAVEAMIARGGAFRCYVTPEELEARRAAGEGARQAYAQALADGRDSTDLESLKKVREDSQGAFRSPYRDGAKPPAPDAPFVVRLRAPDDGDIVNADLVQGEVRVNAREIDDLVLLRADGTPTYMLAVVVDDHDMGVTHVIRGDDHLTNAARQIPIFQAMGWDTPLFAHVPMIHGPDGAKLSKRHGALGVEAYRDLGYLPEALCNYLMRLGWSHGDEEIFSLAQASAWFDLAHVGKAPARLDFDKLAFVNSHYIKGADDARLAALTLAHIATETDWPRTELHKARLLQAMPTLKQRANTIPVLAEQAYFLFRTRPITLDASAQKAMKDDARVRLEKLKHHLAMTPDWEASALGEALKGFAVTEGVGMGQIGPPLRAALTGGAPAPDLSFAMAVLGREETLARIADQI
jgi:glutamyl-tRNA synthetase